MVVPGKEFSGNTQEQSGKSSGDLDTADKGRQRWAWEKDERIKESFLPPRVRKTIKPQVQDSRRASR